MAPGRDGTIHLGFLFYGGNAGHEPFTDLGRFRPLNAKGGTVLTVPPFWATVRGAKDPNI